MKKLLGLLLILFCFLGYSQSNDDLRGGSTQRQGSSRTSSGSSGSNGSGSSSSGGGISANDIGLLIDACGCLYDVGLAFTSEVIIKGIKANTAMIAARRDSFPRIKNMELNLGYGFYPDPFAYAVPKLRLQAGVLGTSFRGWIRLDRTNPFSTDALAYYDWQILEFNVLTRKHATLRFGGGFMFDATTRNRNGQYEKDDLNLYAEITAGADLFFLEDKIRWNLEGRITPFGESKVRKEAFTRVYYRTPNRNRFRPEVFGGANYTQLFDRFNIWYIEAGVGFMIY